MSAAPTRSPWTTPADVLRLLRKRWGAGVFLTRYASGQPWEPLGLALRGPRVGELASRFADVQDWARHWERADTTLMRIQRKRVGGRRIGVNELPCRVWIDSFEQLWMLLKVSERVHRFSELLNATGARSPKLIGWMTAHPMKVLELQACWDRIHDSVRWIEACQRPDLYLRQVDVPGVDTKFIERHRAILTDLLDCELDQSRIDTAAPRSDFAARYGFRKKPEYVRFRLLNGGDIAGFSELSVRTEEFTAARSGISTVYVVENEITYLAFPAAPGAMVILGGGYAIGLLESLTWLGSAELVYWGDIDTHGFAILDRLRRRFPRTRSMLMDRVTLLAHKSQWVTEPNPTDASLDLLWSEEASLYRELVENALGPSVRLEQERVRYSALEQALRGSVQATATPAS
jgi:hypothetical protein